MPTEHPCAQIEGTGIKLTRASLGSDGTLGGFGGGDTTIEGCAQAVTSSGSSIGIKTRSGNAFLAISGLLFKSGTPRLFGGAEFGLGLGRLGADVSQHGSVVRMHGPLGCGNAAQVPPASQGQHGGDQAGGDVGADGGHLRLHTCRTVVVGFASAYSFETKRPVTALR